MTNINWIEIGSVDQLDPIVRSSFNHPVLIYKHSTRCGLSSVVRSRFEQGWANEPLDITCYFLDLIACRSVSKAVELLFQVEHQSPQVLLVINGKCVFHDSHMGVNYPAIREAVQENVPCIPITVAMQLPSEVATRSVGEKDSPLP